METTPVTVFCAAAMTADYDHNVLAPAERAAFKAAANARNLPEAMAWATVVVGCVASSPWLRIPADVVQRLSRLAREASAVAS